MRRRNTPLKIDKTCANWRALCVLVVFPFGTPSPIDRKLDLREIRSISTSTMSSAAPIHISEWHAVDANGFIYALWYGRGARISTRVWFGVYISCNLHHSCMNNFSIRGFFPFIYSSLVLFLCLSSWYVNVHSRVFPCHRLQSPAEAAARSNT